MLIVPVIVGYLIGSCNIAIIIGEKYKHLDVRNYYSKNAGSTNASRVLGYKIGEIIFFFDVLKVPLAMVLAWVISFIPVGSGSGEYSYYIVIPAVIIGHCWPIFFNFKGGKGVACFIGATWMINPFIFIIFSAVWWLLFFVLKKVSICSLSATILVIILCWVPQISGVASYSLDSTNLFSSNYIWFNKTHKLVTENYGEYLFVINICLTLSGFIIIYQHRTNIKRILNGTETKMEFNNNKKIT